MKIRKANSESVLKEDKIINKFDQRLGNDENNRGTKKIGSMSVKKTMKVARLRGTTRLGDNTKGMHDAYKEVHTAVQENERVFVFRAEDDSSKTGANIADKEAGNGTQRSEVGKKEWVSSVIRDEQPNVIELEETKCGLVEEGCVRHPTYRELHLDQVNMDDPNITMEEYDQNSREKASPLRRRAIVFNDAITSEVTPSYEPTVCPLDDNEVDFRISFDESDDEDYTVVYGENSFSYKIISVNNLKTDSENDNEKVNKPSFPSTEPEISYFNDLDFFKDFENEYPAIVYNEALTSKSDFLTEHIVSPQHINEFNETSLSECDEKEQNILYFNDLFPFNVIYLDDLKSDTGNDNDKIYIEQPSRDMSVIPSPNVINVDTQG
ncbi:hypothetical protein Tco_0435138 [Tanacetum coccineum]